VAIEEVLAAVPELRDAESVEPLTGGLTNTNYKVTSPAGCFVVRISGKDTSLLAIDRENEAHNTIAAAETGVGPPFVAALPEHDALVLGYLAVTLTAAIRTEEAHLTEKFGGAYPAYRDGRAAGESRRFSVDRVMRNREYRALLGLAFVLVVLALKIRLTS
jgi:Ser/Thr protein kinase RdoA (MazF antagonist)